MKQIKELKEIQTIELDILKFIDRVCRANNLTYYLAYGTLIGAVRHKGFIPWDDDIDIIMPRKDYEKIIKIMGKGIGNYGMVCVETNKNYNYPWGKVYDKRTSLKEIGKFQIVEYGLWVDIFPIDGLGETKEEALKMTEKIKVNKYRIWTMHVFAKKGIKGRLMNLIGRKSFNRLMLHDCKKNNFYTSKWVGCVIGDDEKAIIEGKHYQEKCELEFEGYKFYAPKEYDKILTMWYGDYMTLPPVEERVVAHDTEIYWK